MILYLKHTNSKFFHSDSRLRIFKVSSIPVILRFIFLKLTLNFEAVIISFISNNSLDDRNF